VLLDEPTAQLDVAASRNFRSHSRGDPPRDDDSDLAPFLDVRLPIASVCSKAAAWWNSARTTN